MVMICDNALDAGLDYIINHATKIFLCSSQPTTYTQASSTYACANATITSGDFAKANGDTSGRKVTFTGKTGGAGTADATGTFLALTDGSSELLAVTACTSQAVTNGAIVDFYSYDITELRDAQSE